MRHFRTLLLLTLLIPALASWAPAPAARAAANGPCETFAPTGRTVCGRFLAYWQNHGGLAQFGYPISAAGPAVSDLNGQTYTMQYFERAILEDHPENAPPADVLLAQLGTYRYNRRYPGGAPQQTPAPGGALFPQTGHRVGSAFLAYWQSRGGLTQFGYPVSDEFPEVSDLNGQTYTVQYFERAVFEHHAENKPPYDVLLSQLGTWRAQPPVLHAAAATTPVPVASAAVAAAPVAAGPPAGAPSGTIAGLAAPGSVPAGAAPGRPFQQGLNLTAWYAGQYASSAGDAALDSLAATGANSLALVVTGYQDTIGSTAISWTGPRTPTDNDLIHVILRAHSLGLRVLLKPHVDLSNDPAHWRGEIGPAFPGETQWQAWFTAYHAFLDHYADLAQQTGVDLLAVGTELVGTTPRTSDWRSVVADVRARYHGALTYAANWGGDVTGVQWWDALDYIGVDAYYPLAAAPDPSVDALTHAWQDRGYVATLAGLAQRWSRPVLFTELGYGSRAGTTIAPYNWQAGGALDLQEQAHAYAAALAVFWGRPWVAGLYWWDWPVDPAAGGPSDSGYSPRGKPAASVLRSYYATGH